MQSMAGRRCFFLLAASVSLLVAANLMAADKQSDAGEVSRLLGQLGNPHLKAEETNAIYEKLLALGDHGPRRLAIYASREVPTRGNAYLQAVEKAAAETLRARWPKDIEQEVNDLRQKVVAIIRQRGDPTEAEIVQQADPAMKRLSELLVVNDADVFARRPELKAKRTELLDMLHAWQRCLEKLAVPDRELSRLPDPKALERDLIETEKLRIAMAMPTSPQDRQVMTVNIGVGRAIDPEEYRGIFMLNMMRIRLGIGALAIDPRLCDAARGHSRDMQRLKFFSHDSPVPGKETPGQRARLVGTTFSGENIAAGVADAAGAIAGWWHSPGHLKNMMGAHRRVGLGGSGRLWTLMFGD